MYGLLDLGADKREMTRDMGETFFGWSEQADQAKAEGQSRAESKTATTRVDSGTYKNKTHCSAFQQVQQVQDCSSSPAWPALRLRPPDSQTDESTVGRLTGLIFYGMCSGQFVLRCCTLVC